MSQSWAQLLEGLAGANSLKGGAGSQGLWLQGARGSEAGAGPLGDRINF